MSPTLVFVHGWGFSPRFWLPLIAELPEYEFINIDLGYFTGPGGVKPLSERLRHLDLSTPLVGVGHSLGFLRLFERFSLVRPAAAVSVCGFPRFTSDKGYPGVHPGMLRKTRSLFAADPLTTLKNFRRNCAADEFSGLCKPEELNEPALLSGLDELASLDMRAELAQADYPLLALASSDDRITPLEMQTAIFAQANLRIADFGGHALPWNDPKWCATQITSFISGIVAR